MEELARIESEQQVQYDRMCRAIGSEALAIFCCCIAYDVPFVPGAVPKIGVEEAWNAYKRSLKAKKGVPVAGKGFNQPLYDTGALYNDFDYEVTSRE